MVDESEDDEFNVPAVVTTILERDEAPDRDGLGRSVLQVIDRLEVFEWPVSGLSRVQVLVSDEFYANDAKIKPGQEAPDYTRGQLKKAAHEKTFWWAHGSYPDLRLGLVAGWEEGVTPKGGRSFKFISAHCADPLGIPTELFVDYSLAAADRKAKKDEPEWAREDRVMRLERQAIDRDLTYNLGQSYLDRFPYFKAFKQFDAWFLEAIEMTQRVTQRKEQQHATAG